jgi:hypothetical protein
MPHPTCPRAARKPRTPSLLATALAFTLATTPAGAASPCSWRMDLPVNPVSDIGEGLYRASSGEPLLGISSNKESWSRFFSVHGEVTKIFNFTDYEMRYNYSNAIEARKLKVITGKYTQHLEPTITLGDTTIKFKRSSEDETASDIARSMAYEREACTDIYQFYLETTTNGQNIHKYYLLALLPHALTIYKKMPCSINNTGIDYWEPPHDRLRLVSPLILDLVSYDEESFVFMTGDNPVIFPYFLRIHKTMTSCGIDSRTIFLLDKDMIDATRLAGRRKYWDLPPEKEIGTDRSRMGDLEVYHLLLNLKKGLKP